MIWGVHSHGTPQWLVGVFQGKSHRSKWMMTRGTPMTMEISQWCWEWFRMNTSMEYWRIAYSWYIYIYPGAQTYFKRYVGKTYDVYPEETDLLSEGGFSRYLPASCRRVASGVSEHAFCNPSMEMFLSKPRMLDGSTKDSSKVRDFWDLRTGWRWMVAMNLAFSH